MARVVVMFAIMCVLACTIDATAGRMIVHDGRLLVLTQECVDAILGNATMYMPVHMLMNVHAASVESLTYICNDDRCHFAFCTDNRCHFELSINVMTNSFEPKILGVKKEVSLVLDVLKASDARKIDRTHSYLIMHHGEPVFSVVNSAPPPASYGHFVGIIDAEEIIGQIDCILHAYDADLYNLIPFAIVFVAGLLVGLVFCK